MKTTAIKVEGQIISPEIFDRLDSSDIKGQNPVDFGFEKNEKVKDRIALAWADAKDQWSIYKRRIESLSEDESGTSETRRLWILPLLENLGYNLSLGRAEIINEDSFAISHRANNIDGFPVHIVGFNDSLDKKRETGGPRLSPHALVQEYLNRIEHLYGIATNGYQLRLLRDSGKLIRLTYLEFDLFRMLEDDLYAEFSIMYRIIHSSRMPAKMDESESSLIEQYHQDSLEAGARIRGALSEAVEKSIISIGNGFLKHPANEELRKRLNDGTLTAYEFYHYLLRFIYRVLFLMVIEERDIIYPDEIDEKTRRLKNIYYNFYSISRIRKLAEKFFLFDEKLEDIWIALRNTFRIFGYERLAQKLNIYPLDGELFDYDALGILDSSNLDNHTLLECIKNLSIFENKETKSLIRVNYAALNVEEFGSVYEGLLEKAPQVNTDGNEFRFTFIKGSERSSSGSHYTPEELVQPLIKHSLDYVIEDKIKNVIASPTGTKQSAEQIRDAKVNALLSIKVCDVACGSGHILLSAARKIAIELARVRTGEDQPSPEPYRQAIRDVINQCIYGVDKNPLAVELCKVALWLEAHNPGMPLNFLDHKIKCGDSIVGLARIEELQNGIATEAFNTMPGDDKTIAASFRKQNKSERENRKQLKLTDTEEIINNLNSLSVKFKNFNLLPDTTVDEVKKKRQEYDVLKGSDWMRLKELADIQVAQFFIDKANNSKEFLTTDAEYFRIFAGQKKEVNIRKISTAMAVAVEKRFFHWFLEFPEVMQEGGFDCILGNPPFLGGSKISSYYGSQFLNCIYFYFYPIGGQCDLVGYFFRRNFYLLKMKSFLSLISTNTISQGDTRESSLEYIVNNGGQINFAIKNTKWPGTAAVEVALLSINKGRFIKTIFLNNKNASFISPFLDSETSLKTPEMLNEKSHKSFLGSGAVGSGFLLTIEEGKSLLSQENHNSDVVKMYLTGDDINNDPIQEASRYCIYFWDWYIEKAKKYESCFKIIDTKVRPEREKNKDKRRREVWWQFSRPTIDLYLTIKDFKSVLVINRHSKFTQFSLIKKESLIFSDATVVIALYDFISFSIMNSSFHEYWSWRYGSTMGSGTLRYTPLDCFETYPFPQNLTKETEAGLEKIGEEYHEFRRQLMLDMRLGLTKTYNLFHDPQCSMLNAQLAMEIREFKSAKLQMPIEETIQRIEKLRALHKQMDEAVLKAYGWTDINLAHNFYEVDYLPENDRKRYTISPEVRKEILKRLLELNHKIHAEEVASGLWEKGKGKKKTKTLTVDEKQGGLFG